MRLLLVVLPLALAELSLLEFEVLTVGKECEEDEWEKDRNNGPTLLGFDEVYDKVNGPE